MPGEEGREEVVIQAGPSQDRHATAHAVSIKPPEFSETSPAIWFKIVEAQFFIRGINQSQTKYFHAISYLPQDILSNVPPEIIDGEDYDDLKEAIICAYEQTKPELFEKLTASTTMTGRPSAYLRRLQQIGSKLKVGDDLIRHQFVSNLPSTISAVVASQKSLNLTALGSMADELMPLHSKINSVSMRDTERRRDGNRQQRYDRSSSARRQETSNKGRHPALQPFHDDQKPKMCRGHIFYAEKSRTCKNWCRYPDKSSCTIQAPRQSSRSSSPASSVEN